MKLNMTQSVDSMDSMYCLKSSYGDTIVTINNEDRLVVFGGKNTFISIILNFLIDIQKV